MFKSLSFISLLLSLLTLSTLSHAQTTSAVSKSLFVNIPAVKVGGDYYAVQLEYLDPAADTISNQAENIGPHWRVTDNIETIAEP